MDPVLKYFNLGPEDIEQPRSNDSQSAKLWGVTLTIDPCIISLSSDPHALRSSMSCGHAITPNCLVAYIFSEIRKGKSTIVCPYAKKDADTSGVTQSSRKWLTSINASGNILSTL
jgi:hypothetical protein